MRTPAAIVFLFACQVAVARPQAPFLTVTIGRSMEPMIHEGMVIKVLPCAFENVRTGMTVIVERASDGMLIGHLCIAAGRAGNGERWIRTRGINNLVADPIRWDKADFVGVMDVPFRGLKP